MSVCLFFQPSFQLCRHSQLIPPRRARGTSCLIHTVAFLCNAKKIVTFNLVLRCKTMHQTDCPLCFDVCIAEARSLATANDGRAKRPGKQLWQPRKRATKHQKKHAKPWAKQASWSESVLRRCPSSLANGWILSLVEHPQLHLRWF